MSEPTKEQIEKARELARVALGYSPTLTTGEAQENMAQALAAETAPLHEKVASLEKQLIGALRALQLSERRRSEAAKTGEVNEHEDLELVLFRPLGRVYRVLRCKVCQSEDTFGISLADNGQWNLECGNCYEIAAVLSEVLAKLR